ncbi:portal protein [Magnetospirillum gryphiswaldense]|uniref:Head-to-tail joining protein n=1 Tax=Magnetospirillum gryphiswaldense TaxID=55518 RepID=A4U092_9PROT|nr:portal protein [Magnetospirillum gryphiswaldense]AVM75271.1 Bacteriophage head to tail connecting protein [Magnetospirillum gryphiswaldense MSR-1]AVM79174.1 Bacteriophage head to tail connecting protein [Magnetospirillum gryphiswaldense]CAM76299.1 head-to-tail joining protein [Magnetospirillum gryphiswaldense MSR-1]
MNDVNHPLGPDHQSGHLRQRYRKAKERRATWEAHWQECYDYALPLRDAVLHQPNPGEKKGDRLFDGTAADAVDQLAASLLSELTPPWAQWFGLTAGPDLDEAERQQVAPLLDKVGAILQSHFDRSNFAVEMHQCYLDVVTGGTACLLFEEAQPGEASAFRFTAVPLAQAVLEEGPDGKLDSSFRRSELTLAALRQRFPAAQLDPSLIRRGEEDPQARFAVIEAVIPNQRGHYDYAAILEDATDDDEALLAEGRFGQSPFINFRWLKAPGEIYGRSPVMKALPDIKTANKVVELVLKNATIAVTGIWQADDDGVLNPANIKLIPGTIIPKAVGSAGLQPLESPGRFDISQLVLDDLRGRIRHALLADKLGQADNPKMTATEVLERSADMARLLGATYGRLQSELLTPLILRAVTILRRRGEIPPLLVDGHLVELQYRSPLAQSQAQRDAHNVLSWLSALAQLGPAGMAVVDPAAAAQWLGRAFNIPADLMVAPQNPENVHVQI